MNCYSYEPSGEASAALWSFFLAAASPLFLSRGLLVGASALAHLSPPIQRLAGPSARSAVPLRSSAAGWFASPQDGLEARASLLQQQLTLGDPCTFRILHKNALTLVTDPALEAEADASLDVLLR